MFVTYGYKSKVRITLYKGINTYYVFCQLVVDVFFSIVASTDYPGKVVSYEKKETHQVGA